MIVRKSLRSIILAVGIAKHFSNSAGLKLLTILGFGLQFSTEARQLLRFSPMSIKLIQLGGVSNKQRRDEIRARIFLGIKMPLGPVPTQTC